MSDRLEELLRQRRLVQEHLAWLDREISAARDEVPISSEASPPVLAPLVIHPVSGRGTHSAAEDAEKILNQYQQDPSTLQGNVKRGCLLAFAAALTSMVVIVGAAYYVYTLYRNASPSPAEQVESIMR